MAWMLYLLAFLAFSVFPKNKISFLLGMGSLTAAILFHTLGWF